MTALYSDVAECVCLHNHTRDSLNPAEIESSFSTSYIRLVSTFRDDLDIRNVLITTKTLNAVRDIGVVGVSKEYL
jgi:hypothetical protein